MSLNKISASQEKRPIIVNGYAIPEISRGELARWADNLTYLSVYSYGYTLQGSLVPVRDKTLIQRSYDSGVAPLMVLTPFDENGTYRYDLVKKLFTDPVFRDRLINEIVMTVDQNNYYGAVFNFGYIAEEDSDQFVITVSKTAARLNRRGYLMIVSLSPGVNDAGINYEALSKAANFLELRTFYWEKAFEQPSAVSPIERIREILSRVITMVDPRFILLGITNFGFDWIIPHVPGTPAEVIFHSEAEERARRTGSEILYEETAQAPHYRYIGMEGLQHEVWYENVRSMKIKLELVYDHHLAGVSIWTIMNPFPAAVAGIHDLFTVYKV